MCSYCNFYKFEAPFTIGARPIAADTSYQSIPFDAERSKIFTRIS